MSNNTARHLYLLVNTTEPERIKAPPAAQHVSGIGIAAAVIVSLLLWAALFWGSAQVLAAITR